MASNQEKQPLTHPDGARGNSGFEGELSWIKRALLVGAGVSVAGWLVVFCFYWFRFNKATLSSDPANWGQFGDYVGGLLNPLLGTLTLATILITVRLQMQLLRDSRRQVDAAEKGLQQAKIAHFVEMQSTRQQAFEETFFRLLEAVNQRATEIEFNGTRLLGAGGEKHVTLRGLEATAKHIARFHWYLHQRGEADANKAMYSFEMMPEEEGGKHTANEIVEAWKKYAFAHSAQLDPLLRSLVNVYNYILTSAPDTLHALDLNDRLRRALEHGGLVQPTFIHGAAFYENIATDHRTRYELKLLAFHAASNDVQSKARISVRAFDVCDSLRDQHWWGEPILKLLTHDPLEHP